MSTNDWSNAFDRRPLLRARERIYAIAGGSRTSGDVSVARLTTAQRIEYFRTPEFRDWVAFEKSWGRQVFWLKDVDKTQAAGDIFTFFFKWRADNGLITKEQQEAIRSYLLSRQNWFKRTGVRATELAWSLPRLAGFTPSLPEFASMTPYDVLRLWQAHEAGRAGITMLDFWSGVYWPSQVGMNREEKLRQVKAFAPTYAAKVYPGVPDDNAALYEAGVEAVIVTNGDHELATACGPVLGIKPENVVGSPLIYDENDLSTGANRSYECFAEEWARRPQPGKPLSFHYWIYMNRKRWGWEHLDDEQIVIAGRDGDSASADGGMMILLPPPAIGNFMVNTPGEPKRLATFQWLAQRYCFTPGQFFTLEQLPSASGAVPE